MAALDIGTKRTSRNFRPVRKRVFQFWSLDEVRHLIVPLGATRSGAVNNARRRKHLVIDRDQFRSRDHIHPSAKKRVAVYHLPPERSDVTLVTSELLSR